MYWFLDPDYLAFVETLNQTEEPPPSIEMHLEEIEAKKCKMAWCGRNNFSCRVYPFRWWFSIIESLGSYTDVLWHVTCHIAKLGLSSDISSMRPSVSSPDETLRIELKIQGTAEYFWQTSRCSSQWWNTVLNAWYYFSNKMILEGEIKDAITSSFSSDFQTLSPNSINSLSIH